MLEMVGICVGCLLMPSPIYRPPNKPMLVGRIPSRSHQYKDTAPSLGVVQRRPTWAGSISRGQLCKCWEGVSPAHAGGGQSLKDNQSICCVGMGMDFVPVSIAVIFISWGLPKAELNWGFPPPQSIKCMAMR